VITSVVSVEKKHELGRDSLVRSIIGDSLWAIVYDMMLMSMNQVHCENCGVEVEHHKVVYFPKPFGKGRKFHCCDSCSRTYLDMISLACNGHEYRGECE
jgi:hypothetical protein